MINGGHAEAVPVRSISAEATLSHSGFMAKAGGVHRPRYARGIQISSGEPHALVGENDGQNGESG
jgi:hypothetical protein